MVLGGARRVRRFLLFSFFRYFSRNPYKLLDFFSIVKFCSVSGHNLKVHSHLASTSTFASALASNFNTVPVGTSMLM